MPLALIFNELLTNSLKHAFKDRENGYISIHLAQPNKNQFVFSYKDDGSWIEASTEQTFGLELINTLCDQLEGTYERSVTQNGTQYKFILQLDN